MHIHNACVKVTFLFLVCLCMNNMYYIILHDYFSCTFYTWNCECIDLLGLLQPHKNSLAEQWQVKDLIIIGLKSFHYGIHLWKWICRGQCTSEKGIWRVNTSVKEWRGKTHILLRCNSEDFHSDATWINAAAASMSALLKEPSDDIQPEGKIWESSMNGSSLLHPCTLIHHNLFAKQTHKWMNCVSFPLH